MNPEEYFKRIGFKGEVDISIECLKLLHKHHVMSVPFEALDVQFGVPIELRIDKIFEKVVKNNRGGYCYELNYLFHALLEDLGFDSHLISASIFDNDSYGPMFDHMAIIVKLDGLWLLDVGFGDLFIEPIELFPNQLQEDKFKLYKLEENNMGELVLLESLKKPISFREKYCFNTEARVITDFLEQNIWKQSSENSYFVKNRVCTLPTETGRKTIFNDSFKVKNGAETSVVEIKDDDHLADILMEQFYIIPDCHKFNRKN